MRISELAKELGIKSAEVIEELKKLGVEGKKAASSIDESDIPKVKKAFAKTTTKKTMAKKAAAKKTTKKSVAKKAATKVVAKKTTKATAAKPEEKKPEEKPTAKKATAQKATPKVAPKPKPVVKADEEAKEKAAKAAEAKAKSNARLAEAIDAKAKAATAEAKARAGVGSGKNKHVVDDSKRARDKRKHEDFLKKKKDNEELKQLEQDIADEEHREATAGDRLVEVDETLTVKELAEIIQIPLTEIIKALFLKGIPVTVNQILGLELAQEIAKEEDYELILKGTDEDEKKKEKEDTSSFPLRPPVITVMGHVDHGKTSLLDAIRKTDVASGEAGGITQHIGAYAIDTEHGKFTFLDTPGHEAFTALRARGAKLTDVVVLVVAADDGVMPQTVEALHHAKAAGVEMIVAVNKIDKPDADPDRVKQELTKYELLPEDWGGSTIFANVSAKSGAGIDNLLEMIHLQSEILELRAETDSPAIATVVESRLDKNRGPLHSIIITKGTLKVGDPFTLGNSYGKVRAMLNDHGERIQSAGPSTPVELLGCNEMCDPGDVMNVAESDKKARQLSNTRKDAHKTNKLARQHVRLENVVEKLHEGEMADLNLIVKADTQGSVDAVRELLGKLEFKEVQLKVIHDGVGGITETDVTLADASDAIVIGFNVRPTEKATKLASEDGVDLRLYTIIYEITEEIKNAVRGILKPKFEEQVIGRAEVRDLFKVSKIGTIAGCMVQDGLVRRNATVRLIRDDIIIYSGILSSVRRFKDDVKEVQQGYECGLTLDKFNDIKAGDVVEVFDQKEVEREL